MAMLGCDDYLCEACRNFNTDGIDGNHPSCSKRYGHSKAVRLGEECPCYEPGVPSGYPVSMERNKRRAEEVTHKLEGMKKDAHEAEGHPQPSERRAYAPERTCHMEVHANLAETEGTYEVWLECDECHWKMPLEPTTPRFKYCPNCGMRIEVSE